MHPYTPLKWNFHFQTLKVRVFFMVNPYSLSRQMDRLKYSQVLVNTHVLILELSLCFGSLSMMTLHLPVKLPLMSLLAPSAYPK